MTHILFLFVDGIGLGSDDPAVNPLAAVEMPALEALLGGRRMTLSAAGTETGRASLFALDACLGVEGMPQSATGQAVLLTGVNLPALLGYHYGPKPNPEVSAYLHNGNLFSALRRRGKQAALLSAYPPQYFAAIESGRRNFSAIPMAAHSAGVPLRTETDLRRGQALSADFTGQGWRERLGLAETPLLAPFQAGERLASLARSYDFSLFEYWWSDYVGHWQDPGEARLLLEMLDQVLDGLASAWDDSGGLVLVTSDHGNLEDLTTHGHTTNPVPALLIGAPALRQAFAARLKSLVDVTPAILRMLGKQPG